MTQQVKGGNQKLKGLRIGTTYNITVRAYEDIVGPVSNTISVQTYPGMAGTIIRYLTFYSIN